MMDRIMRVMTGRPLLARALLLALGLVVAACTNSGGRPGY
jgi:hypothetical protein